MNHPKSILGQQCIGPCMPKNHTFKHPISLQNYTWPHKHVCPIKPNNDPHFLNQNSIDFTGRNYDELTKDDKERLKHVAMCKYEKKSKIRQEPMAYFMPDVEISRMNFLHKYYKIYSVQNMLNWMRENKFAPKSSVKRIINSVWIVYGTNKNNITDLFVDFYNDIIKTKWIKLYHTHLYKYLPKQNQNINFLLNNVFTHGFIKNTMFEFIDLYSDKMDKIYYPHRKIKKMFLSNAIKYIKNKNIN